MGRDQMMNWYIMKIDIPFAYPLLYQSFCRVVIYLKSEAKKTHRTPAPLLKWNAPFHTSQKFNFSCPAKKKILIFSIAFFSFRPPFFISKLALILMRRTNTHESRCFFPSWPEAYSKCTAIVTYPLLILGETRLFCFSHSLSLSAHALVFRCFQRFVNIISYAFVKSADFDNHSDSFVTLLHSVNIYSHSKMFKCCRRAECFPFNFHTEFRFPMLRPLNCIIDPPNFQRS